VSSRGIESGGAAITEAQFELMLGAFREQHNDQSNRTKWLGRRRMTKSFFR